MGMESSEIKIELCDKHRDFNLDKYYPNHTFNQFILFPAKQCRIAKCEEMAYFTSVGVKTPDLASDVPSQSICEGVYEIFREGQSILAGTPAYKRLSDYLYTRILPNNQRHFLAERLIDHYALLILEKLKLDPECSLSDHDKHKILLELGVYPSDMTGR